jgi:hypothetical protein
MDIKFGPSHWLRVFKNRVLRKTPGPKTVEGTWDRKKLNEQLLDMYFSPNIFWVIKVRKIR